MQVVQVMRFGGPEVLVPKQLPDLVPRPGQVVVQVEASDVLSVDIMIRSGQALEYFPITPPYVPGNGVSGRVISTGEGVDRSWVGQEVAVHTGGSGGSGGYAEQAVASSDDLVAVPEGLGTREAAALLHDGVTALGLMEGIGVRSGEWVLVTAAAGGMGVLLIQLALRSGGKVIGAARGARKLKVIRELGAAVVDYSEPGWTERVRTLTAGHGPDVVFDGAGGRIGTAAFEVMAPGGRLSTHGMSAGGFAEIDRADAERRGVTVRGIGDASSTPAELRRLATLALSEAAAGRLKPVIGQTFPLSRAADAHAAMETRSAIGKTLLVP